MTMLFESHFRLIIRHLLAEGKVDVLQARHPDIDVSAIAKLDPTPQKKYLEWMIGQYSNENANIDDDEMKEIIDNFHVFSREQRLPRGKYDINAYASLDDVKAVLDQVSDISKTQQRKIDKLQGSKLIYKNEGYKVYEISTHAACRLLGSTSKWCIAGKSDESWLDYQDSSKFIFAISEHPKVMKDYNLEKISFELSFQKVSDSNSLRSLLTAYDAVNTIYTQKEFDAMLAIHTAEPYFNELRDVFDFVKTISQNLKPSLLNLTYFTGTIDSNDVPKHVIDALRTQPITSSLISTLLLRGLKPVTLLQHLNHDDGVYYEVAKMYQDGKLEQLDEDTFRRKGHNEQIYIGHNSEFAEDGVFFYEDEVNLHRGNGPTVRTSQGRVEWWLYGELQS